MGSADSQRGLTRLGATMDGIPLETAHRFLATLGVMQATKAYERWARADGFDMRDFESLLSESPFVFTIDWRSALDEELEIIARSLARLDITLETDLDEGGDSGFVSCVSGRRAAVSYGPTDDDFDDVFRGLQCVVPEGIEFRTATNNHGRDTWVYAVLTRVEWAELERLAPDVTSSLFRPLPPGRKS